MEVKRAAHDQTQRALIHHVHESSFAAACRRYVTVLSEGRTALGEGKEGRASI